MKNTKNNTPTQQQTPAGRPVEESRAVSLNVTGGKMTGTFVRYATRTGREGEQYSGWILKDASGIIAKRDRNSTEVKPEAAPVGRYFVFAANRLDRMLREVEQGERITITYLGKQSNEKTESNPDGEGSHHAYTVVYND